MKAINRLSVFRTIMHQVIGEKKKEFHVVDIAMIDNASKGQGSEKGNSYSTLDS